MDSLLNVANSFQTIFFSKFAQQYNPYLCSRRNKRKKKKEKKRRKEGTRKNERKLVEFCYLLVAFMHD